MVDYGPDLEQAVDRAEDLECQVADLLQCVRRLLKHVDSATSSGMTREIDIRWAELLLEQYGKR